MSPRAPRRQTQTATAVMPPAPETNMVSGASATSPASRFERIAQRAYALYERRGGEGGSAVEDWLQAEREIDAEA